jgi:hypothetical protein
MLSLLHEAEKWKKRFSRDKITANKKCFDGICGGMLENVGQIQ